MALEFAKGLEQIWADERAIRQICLNLMSNALKFTPARRPHHACSVSATPDGGQMLIVKDTGPGIPKEEIPRVMQAFGQGSLAHQTAEGGTGLGLPIVQNLVDLHGGTFELRSELRKGTEAVVCLPGSRVLRTMPPLQPLGQERHRRPPAASPQRQQARAVAGGPQWRAIHSGPVSHIAIEPTASYIPAGGGSENRVPALRVEANADPLHQRVRDRRRARACARDAAGRSQEIAGWAAMTDVGAPAYHARAAGAARPGAHGSGEVSMGAWIALTLLVIAGLALLLRAMRARLPASTLPISPSPSPASPC